MFEPPTSETINDSLTELTEAELEQKAAKALAAEKKKLLGLAVGVIIFMVIAHYSPLRPWLMNVQSWKTYVREWGWMAHLSFVLASALAVAVGIPRLPLCGMAGLAFGFSKGLLVSWTGTALGAYLAFLLTRLGFSNLKGVHLTRYAGLKKLLEAPRVMGVFWARQLMVPGIVTNVLLGISKVTQKHFIIGTLIGYLPLNISVTLVGSGIGKSSLTESMTQIILSIGLINFAAWLLWRFKKQSQITKNDK